MESNATEQKTHHSHYLGEQYLSDIQVARRYGTHRTTIWRWVEELGYPAPVKLSSKCSRWRLTEILHWENMKAEERG